MSAPVRNRGVVLSELHTDETHGLQVGITKEVVETVLGAQLGAPKYGVGRSSVSGGYIETQALNKMRSITICSKIVQSQTELDALAITIPGTIDFPWPATLQGVTLFNDEGKTAQSASGTFSSVTIGGGYHFGGGVGIKMEEGPRSRSVSSMARTFHLGVPTIGTSVTKIVLSSGMVVVKGGAHTDYTTYSASALTAGQSNDTSDSNTFQTIPIPGCLTNGIGISTVGFGQATGVLQLDDSTPTAFASGDVIVATIDVIQWRFGVFITEITRATRP